MDQDELIALLDELRALPHEVAWVEFKENQADVERIGQYISALSNSATLYDQDRGYLVWGIADETHEVLGTKFKPHQTKKGNENLENWLLQNLSPRITVRMYEFIYQNHPIVLLEVPPAYTAPTRFSKEAYIRIGSYTKKLSDFPDQERQLWLRLQQKPFGDGIAATNLPAPKVLEYIDYPTLFQLFNQPLPTGESAVIEKLAQEGLILPRRNGNYDITNLGAILFATNLNHFKELARKAVRVILYSEKDRMRTKHEHLELRGYATGFVGLIAYINNQLPGSEHIGQALRSEVTLYPALAIRELVANALIHQDFLLMGTGPMIEIFTDRIEITNPGSPLIEPLRFIDQPPLSRNERLASLMRRLNICEERGSGIDKVITAVEFFQLPPPDFQAHSQHTRVILQAPKTLSAMSQAERVRACYQHVVLQYVSNDIATNTTLAETIWSRT